MKYLLMVAMSFLLCIPGLVTAEEIAEKNWVNHPEIVKVRMIYQKIIEARDAGKFELKERHFKTDDFPYEDDLRILYLDKNGKPRIYKYEGGSDDSAVKREMYYDENGMLRFAFIRAGAYNDTVLEHRIYFSPSGKRLWEDRKLLSGPGYTFPHEWPDEEMIKNPQRAFDEKSPCPEENNKSLKSK